MGKSFFKIIGSIPTKDVTKLKRASYVFNRDFAAGEVLDLGVEIPANQKVFRFSGYYENYGSGYINANIGTAINDSAFGTLGFQTVGVPEGIYYSEASIYRPQIKFLEATTGMIGTKVNLLFEFVEE